MLEIKNLSISYDKKSIVNDVNLSLETRSSLTILGANGCGKSSLAKAISGLIDFKGSIDINKQNIEELNIKDRAKLCAYIPAKLESYDLQISVREFVLIGRFAHKSKWANYSKEDYDKVDAVLKELNLLEISDQPLGTLSSGQQQLLMIAQALVQETPLIIFDEPTAHLDPKNVVHFVKLFKQLKEKYTLILITHDIQLAQTLDQTILFIQDHKALLYKENFFNPQTLLKHYGVAFKEQTSQVGLCFD